jgi:hypothetical protein
LKTAGLFNVSREYYKAGGRHIVFAVPDFMQFAYVLDRCFVVGAKFIKHVDRIVKFGVVCLRAVVATQSVPLNARSCRQACERVQPPNPHEQGKYVASNFVRAAATSFHASVPKSVGAAKGSGDWVSLVMLPNL